MIKLTYTLLSLLLTTALTAQINFGEVVINEFSADSDSLSGIADPDGGYPDWIELYNNTDRNIDLSDTYLSDKIDDLLKWRFPTGTTIEPDGYLIIWADEDLDQRGLHANFKLSRTGEAIYLSNADESRIDRIEFSEQMTNTSSSRVPNGTGFFLVQHSTPLFSNDTPVSSRRVESALPVQAYPNPVDDLIYVTLPEGSAGEYSLEVLTLSGQAVITGQAARAGINRVDVRTLPGGIYLIRVIGADGRAGSFRFSKR